MRTDKIRKYLIPNIPYLFILWAFLKLGTAYRLAAGNDFAHKLIGLGQTIGPAFADFAPGLAPLDWLVGIVGAVGFRLLIYFKSKNAKKFRRDAEYGSARWGTEKDIKPFVDPKFENNVILTGTEFLTMNTRPKIPANARNLNCCIIGSSGSGKTRFWLTPQLLQAHSSYVVVDPKGGVLGQVGGFLQKRGYKIKVFNSIDFSKSMHYNPLAYIRNEADILKFVDALISNTKGEGKEGDPFWTKSETLLYCALIAYIIFEGPAEDRNMNTLVDMISGMEVKEDDEDFMNAVDYMFAGLEKRKPDCFAVKQYKKYKLASGEGVRKVYEEILVPAGMGDVALCTELGRFMLAPYGHLVTRAIHAKHIYKEYIGTDACACDLMRPAMYGSYHHITVMGKEDAPCDHKYDIVGGLCENNDKFAVDRMLPRIDIGDLLVIHDAGAHGLAMGYNYNGKLRCAEVLLQPDGSTRLIRRAETPEDYFATMIWDD